MHPCRRILLAGTGLLLAATAIGAQGSVPAGYLTQSSTQLAAGVDHEALTLTDPAQSVHVARVEPGAARVVAVSAGDLAHPAGGGELPSDMCRRVGCLAGINADFHDAATGEPVGGVVSGGRLLRSPVPGRAQLIVTRDGRLQAGPLDWSGSVTASDGRTVAIGGINVDPHPGDVVLYTSAWGADTPASADTELVVRAAPGTVGAIGATTPLEIVGVRGDPGPVPPDAAVLAASGSASATLHELADRADAGLISRTISLRIRTTVDASESVGGDPVLLRDGHPAFSDGDDSFTRTRHARALVGWTPAGEVVLVTVDAGRGDASGMTLAEAADLLVGLGATDGFGLDGGTATFVAGGEVQNLPVDDGDPGVPTPTGGREVAPDHMERPAVNALMVVPKPADPPPAGAWSGSDSGHITTTPTTAPVKLTVAGGSAKPGVGAAAAPGATAGDTGLPASIDQILRNPTTKRPRRQTGKGAKTKKNKDGQPAAVDSSIPDWNDINAALTPDAVAGAGETDGLALAAGTNGQTRSGHGHGLGPELLELVAAGMIGSVLWGLQRARNEGRPRPALWL